MHKCPKCGIELQVHLAIAGTVGAVSTLSEDRPGLKELLDQIDEGTLEANAAKFVRETKARFADYGERTRMSDRQMDWLRKIAAGANRKDEW